MPSLDAQINKFRLAARELFNNYFRQPSRENSGEAWAAVERFSQVERELFRVLVVEPCELPIRAYHQDIQSEIGVRLKHDGFAPIMVGRKDSPGSWDDPMKTVHSDTSMTFSHFFDWDQTDYIDNRYAEVVIDHCPTNNIVDGRNALIETQYVEFFRKTKK